MDSEFFDEEQKSLPAVENVSLSKDFWGDDLSYLVLQNNKKQLKHKKTRAVITRVFVIIVVFLMCLSFILTQLLGKGWLRNQVFDKNRVSIVIPVQNKPKLDKKYYDEATGQYTPEGIAKAVMPSVVSIEIFEKGASFLPSSQGSGIILTENGYIITNAHVVENATRSIKVILDNKKEYQAVIIGSDKKTDLAVIKVNAEGLTPANFGNSDELSIGEEIVALGSPAGLYGSLTKGVVSGLNRMIKTEATNLEMNCIQIDAAINPGNSGGALVNMYGQVVGINSSKFMSAEYEGIGFAISINAARPILEALIADGYIKDRIRVGISFYEISEESAKINNSKAGLLVKEIDASCDIAKTDLQVNDTITKINRKSVYMRADVDEVMKGKKPGDEVSATVYRKDETGREKTFEIKFKLMKDTSTEIDTSNN